MLLIQPENQFPLDFFVIFSIEQIIETGIGKFFEDKIFFASYSFK